MIYDRLINMAKCNICSFESSLSNDAYLIIDGSFDDESGTADILRFYTLYIIENVSIYFNLLL